MSFLTERHFSLIHAVVFTIISVVFTLLGVRLTAEDPMEGLRERLRVFSEVPMYIGETKFSCDVMAQAWDGHVRVIDCDLWPTPTVP